MQQLSAQIWHQRAHFLDLIRQFFREQALLEVETPLWNRYAGFEAHLDSLVVTRQGVHKSPEQTAQRAGPAGYLITSPEYNLKILLSQLRKPIFQIAHCFREGDQGRQHSEEFLMLEWYLLTADLEVLMDFCAELLHCLHTALHGRPLPTRPQRHSVQDLLAKHARVSLARPDLIELVRQHGWSNDPESLAYDDLFFLVFLNAVEPQLQHGLYFIYDYPAELSALSIIEGDVARRFEIYWDGLELANAYQELRFAPDYEAAYDRESRKREAAGRPPLQLDAQLIQALKQNQGLPPACGIALGLDRLFALLHGYASLATSSPFAQSTDSSAK